MLTRHAPHLLPTSLDALADRDVATFESTL